MNILDTSNWGRAEKVVLGVHPPPYKLSYFFNFNFNANFIFKIKICIYYEKSNRLSTLVVYVDFNKMGLDYLALFRCANFIHTVTLALITQ